MIGIVTVDDRPLYLEYLRSAIHWETYGFRIVGEAKNGVEALEVIARTKPDIVLADINMPKMDGLTLSEHIKDKYPHMDIVLITGISAFEMARRAVKIGVSDYILKPFEKEELVLTLLRLRDNIRRTHELRALRDSERELFFESFLRSIIYDDCIHADQLKTKLDVFDITIQRERFSVAVMELITDGGTNQATTPYWRDTAIQMIDEMLDVGTYHAAFTDYEGRIVSLVEMQDSQSLDMLYEDYEKLMKLFNKHIGIHIAIGIGTPHDGYDGIKPSYNEGVRALMSRYNSDFDFTRNLIRFDKISSENKRYTFYSAEINEQMLRLLRNNDRDGAQKLLDDVLARTYTRQASAETINLIFMGLLSLVLSFISQSGNQVSDVFRDDLDAILGMGKAKGRAKKHELMTRCILKTCEYFTADQTSRAAIITKRAVVYIHEHYKDSSITVPDIAASLYINESHLRNMFKKQSGMTVIEYISKVRIEAAKELIMQNRYTLSAIAEMVGYYDAAYLSKTFKKYYGVSPSRYKNLDGRQ